MTWEVPKDLVRLEARQLRRAGEVLAAAFWNDPLMVHYLPVENQRARVLPGLMLAALRYCYFYGEAWATSGLEGVAGWLPPEKTEETLWGLLRAGLGVVSARIGWKALHAIREIEPQVTAIHRQEMPSPHWYLSVLGVNPGCQGLGYGASLVKPLVARATSAGLPCYLETMLEHNVVFYRKMGFTVARQVDLAGSRLHMWAMCTSVEVGRRWKSDYPA